jgi:hypothetical protein
VSVTTANGVSGSVATATTTPAITLTLGAITPTTVTASSTVQGTQLISTVSTGTAPLTVTSTTQVTNLNASTLTGLVASTTPTASTIAEWDANKNISANNLIDGFRTQATANSTLTLTISDTSYQYLTGTTAGQIVKLPTTSVVAGGQYTIVNSSSQSVAVQSSGANAILTIAANNQGIFTAIVATPTTAANWSFTYSSANNSSPPVGTVTSVTFTGDGTVLSSTPSSAVTASGTLTASLNTQTANKVLAGPTSGGAASPTFRALVQADLGANSTWTPVDSSGASLTFTNVSASYSVIGNMVFAYGTLTYPSTGDGSNALIGGLPFTTANASYARSGGILTETTSSTVKQLILTQNSTTFDVRDASANQLTNTQLSTVTLRFMIIYPLV